MVALSRLYEFISVALLMLNFCNTFVNLSVLIRPYLTEILISLLEYKKPTLRWTWSIEVDNYSLRPPPHPFPFICTEWWCGELAKECDTLKILKKMVWDLSSFDTFVQSPLFFMILSNIFRQNCKYLWKHAGLVRKI